MKVSVITTVKNEAATIASFLDFLLAQTRKPEEVVIVDGGSSDGTVDILRRYEGRMPLKILVHPGYNISQGRNAAVAAACGEIIASTDAGVRLHPRWLEHLVAPFEEKEAPDVVSGFFVPDPRSVFEISLAATTLPSLSDIARGKGLPRWLRRILLFIEPQHFLPSSRSVAFRKTVWERVGGYPEWLDYSEDLIFDLALRRAGFRFYFELRAIVYFRPRQNLGPFLRQYFRYARGDGKARLWTGEHLMRYATYLVVVPLLALLGGLHNPLWWLLLFLGAGIYLLGPYRRLVPMMRGLKPGEKVQAILWVPIIRLGGDLAKMLGYPAGVGWRWRKD